MRSAWIVVANASRARLFERVSERGRIEPLASIEDPELRTRGSPHGTVTGQDRDARLGRAGAAYARLARDVAEYLNEGVLNDRCARLQLFAAAPILSAIREHMHLDTVRVCAEHDTQDLTAFSTEELERRIADLCGASSPTGLVR